MLRHCAWLMPIAFGAPAPFSALWLWVAPSPIFIISWHEARCAAVGGSLGIVAHADVAPANASTRIVFRDFDVRAAR